MSKIEQTAIYEKTPAEIIAEIKAANRYKTIADIEEEAGWTTKDDTLNEDGEGDDDDDDDDSLPETE